MFRDIIICLILLFGCEVKIYSQIEQKGFPLIGAQVFIEPGQTEEETEIWFRQIISKTAGNGDVKAVVTDVNSTGITFTFRKVEFFFI